MSLPYTLYQGDCLDVLRALPDCSVDAVVTDPPYDLTDQRDPRRAHPGGDWAQTREKARGFMGMSWDGQGIAFRADLWAQVCRVLKPGGHLLAFGGTRTYHRMACAIEDAGFEIRDSLHWAYGSGFPKSLDVSKAIDKQAGAEREVTGTYRQPDGIARSSLVGGGVYALGTDGLPKDHPITAPATPAAQEWAGWGTALKPAHEPIVMARKPLIGTVADNVQAWGTGAINVDGCRVGSDGGGWNGLGDTHDISQWRLNRPDGIQRNSGRWPANLLLTHSAGCNGTCAPDCPVRLLDEQSGIRAAGAFPKRRNDTPNIAMRGRNYAREIPARIETDTGGASRFFFTADWEPDLDGVPPFFYCAKASRSERNEGNGHPTVKPVRLMAYLCRLITPPGGVVLDPFMGSGTTGVAAFREGFRFAGIEREAEYMQIAQARITTAYEQARQTALPLEVA